MIRRFRIFVARRRLQRMVDRQRQSFRVQDYARRREAMLKHTRQAVP
jgi:hypothetical protein